MALIDQTQLSTLRELSAGDASFLISVIDAFLPQLREIPASLRQGVESGSETDSLAELAHSLKGSAGNVGAEDVYRICLAIEQHARAGEVAKLPQLVSELETAAASTHRAFEAEKTQLG